MNRTFTVMKSNVGQFIGDSSTEMLTLIGKFLNDRLIEVYRRCNLLDTTKTDYQFSTVSGTEDYAMPYDFGKEISVIDVTNKLPLSRTDMQKLSNSYTSRINDTGETMAYVILDKTVLAQPSSASTISTVSSSASDTSAYVYIKGLDANGMEIYESILNTGTTPAISTKTYSKILLIAKTAATVGNITLTSNSGAVTNAVMSAEMLEYRVKVMRLFNIPNTASTIEINYIQRIMPMSQNQDYPILPCEEVLEAGAIADGWRFKRQFAKAADYEIIFEKRLANLIFDMESQPNKINKFQPQTYSYHEGNGGNVDDCRRYGVY